MTGAGTEAVLPSESALAPLPAVDVLGTTIHAVGMQQALDACASAIDTRTRFRIGVVNAAKMVNMRRQPLLAESVAGSDLVLADGAAVVWASRILRRPLPERVAGIDLFENLLELGNERGYSAYFFGARQEVLDEVLLRVGSRFPNLRIAGSRNGYYDDDQAEEIAADIAQSRPDMLFIGITSPRKELFLAAFADQMAVPVSHGVGGSFDVFAGKVSRAPRVMQKLGLEWLHRVYQEPRRMWKRYAVTNTLFIGMVLRALITGGGATQGPQEPTNPGDPD